MQSLDSAGRYRYISPNTTPPVSNSAATVESLKNNVQFQNMLFFVRKNSSENSEPLLQFLSGKMSLEACFSGEQKIINMFEECYSSCLQLNVRQGEQDAHYLADDIAKTLETILQCDSTSPENDAQYQLNYLFSVFVNEEGNGIEIEDVPLTNVAPAAPQATPVRRYDPDQLRNLNGAKNLYNNFHYSNFSSVHNPPN